MGREDHSPHAKRQRRSKETEVERDASPTEEGNREEQHETMSREGAACDAESRSGAAPASADSKVQKSDTATESEEVTRIEPKKQTSEQQNASQEKSQQPPLRWPWIPLMDTSGRQYFYNALTSKTSWTMTEDTASSTQAPPPTAFTAASAQAAWQQYWDQWQKAQAAESLTRCVPGLTQPPPDVQKRPEGDTSRPSPSVAAAMSVYIEHYQTPTAKQLGRPARQQVRPPENESLGYTQGYEEYNIWYGKHLTDRFENPGPFGRREEREKATTRCNPFTDSGWTRCDLEPALDRPVVCIYFARGCCYLGSNCRYYHRLPTAEDDEKLDMLHDIFGRERFASHRDDMDGVGTFSEDCRTLFIGDLKVNRVYPNAEEKTEELIRQQFGLWGPLEDIKVIRNKNIAFIRYKYRVHAEFAKVAMAEQRLLLDRPDDQICVKWAHPGRGSEDKPDEQHAREWEQANQAMMKRLATLGYTQDDLECLIRWEIQNAAQERPGVVRGDQGLEREVVSTYPNTDQRVAASTQVPAPLADQVPPPDDDLSDLTRPDSAASMGFYKMQAALSRIEGSNQKDAFTVDL